MVLEPTACPSKSNCRVQLLDLLFAIWPWANDLFSLGLSFLIRSLRDYSENIAWHVVLKHQINLFNKKVKFRATENPRSDLSPYRSWDWGPEKLAVLIALWLVRSRACMGILVYCDSLSSTLSTTSAYWFIEILRSNMIWIAGVSRVILKSPKCSLTKTNKVQMYHVSAAVGLTFMIWELVFFF